MSEKFSGSGCDWVFEDAGTLLVRVVAEPVRTLARNVPGFSDAGTLLVRVVAEPARTLARNVPGF